VVAEDALAADRLSRIAGAEDALLLAPSLIDARRGKLASGGPSVSFLRRGLEFVPLSAPELPEGFEVPDDFVAVRFEAEQAEIASALGARAGVVELEGLERDVQTVVLGRARGFVGTYGVEAYLAVLLGVPAVVFPGGSRPPAEDDLRVASSFLTGPRFGRLHVLEAAGSPAEAAARAERLLEEPAGILAGV
jgi:hypothetical protein